MLQLADGNAGFLTLLTGLQVGHTGPLMPSEFGRPIPYLDDVAREFPDLKIVGGHVGFPWTNEMLALAMKYPNVCIDTSAYVCKRYPQELVRHRCHSAARRDPHTVAGDLHASEPEAPRHVREQLPDAHRGPLLGGIRRARARPACDGGIPLQERGEGVQTLSFATAPVLEALIFFDELM